MIEVIFLVHARGKVSTRIGSLAMLPGEGQMITIKGNDYKVVAVQEETFKSTRKLSKPEIDIEPVN